MAKRTLQLVGLLGGFLFTATIGAREAGSCSLVTYGQPSVPLTEAALAAPLVSTPLYHADESSGGCGEPACGGGPWTELDVEALGLDRLAVRSTDGEIRLYEPAGRQPDGRTFRFIFYSWELPSSAEIDVATVTSSDERGAWTSVTLSEELFR
ncbi:MAG: hypothetical protein RMA76_02050 [Deltaproteobacteria bacterium]|jgi:hypothetical protein